LFIDNLKVLKCAQQQLFSTRYQSLHMYYALSVMPVLVLRVDAIAYMQ